MSFIFGDSGPSAPPPAPSVATPSVQAAAQAARRRERTASGSAATMLTDQSSLSSANVGVKKLGGALPSNRSMGSKALLG